MGAARAVLVWMLVFCQTLVIVVARTDSNDLAVLNALKASWSSLPPNWVGGDPCGSNWEGIICNGTRVTSLRLAGTGVEGTSISDISSLTALQYLDLSNNIGLRGILPPSIGNLRNLIELILIGCSFFGPIPDSIGSLQQLVYISLNSNRFSGPIPPSLGNLSRLSWLDLSDNLLNGTIPISSGAAPGLDKLRRARHFHLSRNQLFGTVPEQLFNSNMSLMHAIFDNNALTGNLPASLGSVTTLEVIRFDWNSLNGSIPDLSSLTNLSELYLSNNNFNGNIPNLSGLTNLSYLDMSNNSFNASRFPDWFSGLPILNTIIMANTTLQGPIPVNIFRPQLQTMILSYNDLNGTLDIGNNYNSILALDLQNNSISNFQQRTSYNMEITLVGNPICNTNGPTERFCSNENHPNNILPSTNCGSITCRGNKILSPNCQCSNPYTGTVHFYSYSFSDLQNTTYYSTLNGTFMSVLLSSGLPVGSLIASNPSIDIYSYLHFTLQIFPSGQDSFNRTSISTISFLLNRQSFPLPYFGPFFFLDQQYCCFSGSRNSSHVGLIVGVTVGGSILVILIVLAGIYALRQKKIAKRAREMNDPFASWDPEKESGAVPQLQGAKWFSFEELQKCTSNFSETNCIGSGGYGKVYKATLASSQVVAIKRAQQGSMQGASEFKTEIELLSGIHHKNVVRLVGFCYEQGEQLLVYEYMSNGTVKDGLSGKWLDWNTRLRIALDAARGLSYMHELTDPPIIHRDIKSTNILLDSNMNAKVADFGLSKLLGDTGKGYVTTQVKGTLGYMDPEYYMTNQLTEKSDVYSFGVVLLELITGRAPIQQGKYIVRLVQEAMGDESKPNSLDQVIDPTLKSSEKLGGLRKFIDLAMTCARESANDRPTMGEVVREIENIMELASLDKNKYIIFSPSSFEETTNDESPLNSEGFDVSRGSFPFYLERRS